MRGGQDLHTAIVEVLPHEQTQTRRQGKGRRDVELPIALALPTNGGQDTAIAITVTRFTTSTITHKRRQKPETTGTSVGPACCSLGPRV